MSGILTDVTEDRWMEREKSLAEKVGRLALNSSSIDIDGVENLVVRDILPQQDFNGGADNGATYDGTGDELWTQDLASSGSNNAYNEAYQVDSNDLAEDKIIGIMGISVLHSDLQTRQLRFSLGQGGNQGVKREVNIEPLETDNAGRAMFLTDLIFDAKEHGVFEHYQEQAADGERIVYHGYTAEPVGETLSEPSSPQLAQQSGGRGR